LAHKNSIITITGNVTVTSANTSCIGVEARGGQYTINGNLTGGVSSANTAFVINDGGTNGQTNVTVNGDVSAGNPNGGAGIETNLTLGLSWVKLNGTVNASASQHGVVPLSASAMVGLVIASGEVHDHVNGYLGINYVRTSRYMNTASLHSYDFNGASMAFYSSGTWTGELPVISDVRAGVTYGVAGAYTGDCIIPSPAAVILGVPVDHTVGEAIINGATMPSAISIAEAVRTELTPELTRVAACATVESTGSQLAAFNAP
jgi:hypothetical protein